MNEGLFFLLQMCELRLDFPYLPFQNSKYA